MLFTYKLHIGILAVFGGTGPATLRSITDPADRVLDAASGVGSAVQQGPMGK